MQGLARHQGFVIFAPFVFQWFRTSAMKPAKKYVVAAAALLVLALLAISVRLFVLVLVLVAAGLVYFLMIKPNLKRDGS